MKSGSPDSRLMAGWTRRSFFGRAATSALLLGSSFPATLKAQDETLHGGDDYPVPIPHINTPPPGSAHIYFPGPVSGAAAPTDPSGAHPEGRDPSPIFNFKGIVGQVDFELTGIGTDLTTGQTAPYTFHTDMRFMDGVFVGTDLVERQGAFAFV
jgi:hypothetical protein